MMKKYYGYDDDEESGADKFPATTKVEMDLTFKTRSIIITGTINDRLARSVSAQLLALADESAQPIRLFISSPGGHVESGDMIHDIIKFIKPVVTTIGSGWVASAGALIFVGAARENRVCLPNTRFLLHQPAGGVGGTASDISIQARQIEIMRGRLEKIFAEATGQSEERIRKDMARDFWLSASDAIAYGLTGRIVKSIDDLSL